MTTVKDVSVQSNDFDFLKLNHFTIEYFFSGFLQVSFVLLFTELFPFVSVTHYGLFQRFEVWVKDAKSFVNREAHILAETHLKIRE